MTSSVTVLGFTSDLVLWQILVLTVVSLFVGVLGGFLGLALGTIRLPALLLMGVAPPIAAGTNILVSTVAALSGSARHLREGRVILRVVAMMGIPSVIGAFAGGFFGSQAPISLLLAMAGAFVMWQGVELHMRLRRQAIAARSTPGEVSSGKEPTGLSPGRYALEGGVGLGIGLLGGSVGLILGTMRLPLLINVLKLNPRMAAGTNLPIGMMLGVFGFVGHGLRGEVDVPLLLAMGGAAAAGSAYGARLTGRVNMNTLVRAMSVILVVVGGLLLWRASPFA